MIPVSEIDLIVFSIYQQPQRLVQDWLDHFHRRGGSMRYAWEFRVIDLAREQVCNRFLNEAETSGKKHILMLDADTAPMDDAILDVPGEIVYLGCPAREGDGGGHFGPGDFSCGCCRISLAALRTIKKPWFEFDRRADLILGCECESFLKKAAAAGFEPKMVGQAYHLGTIASYYDKDRKLCRSWPDRIRSMRERNLL